MTIEREAQAVAGAGEVPAALPPAGGDSARVLASRRRARFRFWRSIGIRVLIGAAILLVVSFVIYWATSVLPGDVVTAVLGTRSDPASRDLIRQQLHLDDPLLVRSCDWLGAVLRGDFGTSFATKAPVIDIVGPRIISTTILVFIGSVIGIPLAATIGTLAATKPRGWLDNVTNIGSVALGAIPDFVIGLLLVMLFATSLMHVLPAISISSPGWSVFDDPVALILPVATIVLAMAPYLVRVARSSVLEALQSDYVAAATLRGVPRRRVVLKHALRNALSPIVHSSALVIGITIGGTAVVEYIFQYPGIGAGLVQAVSQRDVPTIQVIALLIAAVWIATNIVADVVAMLLSPRRHGGGI